MVDVVADDADVAPAAAAAVAVVVAFVIVLAERFDTDAEVAVVAALDNDGAAEEIDKDEEDEIAGPVDVVVDIVVAVVGAGSTGSLRKIRSTSRLAWC